MKDLKHLIDDEYHMAIEEIILEYYIYPENTDEEYLTIDKAAELLGVSVDEMDQYTYPHGLIIGYRLGQTRLYKKSDICRAWFNQEVYNYPIIVEPI